jgi:hypothetical protein
MGSQMKNGQPPLFNYGHGQNAQNDNYGRLGNAGQYDNHLLGSQFGNGHQGQYPKNGPQNLPFNNPNDHSRQYHPSK